MKCKICRSIVQGFACGSKSGKQETVYYYCSGCGFIFKDDAYILPPEKERDRYLQHTNSPEDIGYTTMLKSFLERAVHAHVPPEGQALDFGSGPEPVLAALMEHIGYKVDIYDIYFSPEKIFKGKSYHLITCTEVIEHLVEPLETLALLKSLLKPDGILAIMTLFHQGIDHFKNWWYRRDATHISFFQPDTFHCIAGELDMHIVFIDDKNTVSFQR